MEKDVNAPLDTFDTNEVLVEVKHLKKFFPIKKGIFSKISGYVKAVDDVVFIFTKARPWDWWARVAVAKPQQVGPCYARLSQHLESFGLMMIP